MFEELARVFDRFTLLADKSVAFVGAHWALECVSFFHTSIVHGV